MDSKKQPVVLEYIENESVDFKGNLDEITNLHGQVFQLMIQQIQNFYTVVSPNNPIAQSSVGKQYIDYSLYDGSGGSLFLYLKLYNFFENLDSNPDKKKQLLALTKISDSQQNEFTDAQQYLKDAEILYKGLQKLFEQNTKNKDRRINITFYMGQVGIFTLGCQLFYLLENTKAFNQCLYHVLSVKKYIVENKNNPKMDFELLYGVSGYLYCLLNLQTKFQFPQKLKNQDFRINIERDVIDICQVIIDEGLRAAGVQNPAEEKEIPKNFRLVYQFGQKQYLGGAHGLFGIMYEVLKAYQLNMVAFQKYQQDFSIILLKYSQQSILLGAKCQLESGNFPTSMGKLDSDRLVQFCHGATGAVACLLLAADLFQDQALLSSAEKAGDCLWKKGIIKKGYGLCHGISGNAYALLSLYQSTKNPQWLFRALVFASLQNKKSIMQVILNHQQPDRKAQGLSDFPFSLVNGLAGDLCLITDLIFPQNAAFPGYEV